MQNVKRILSNTTPLCFMPDGRLVCYQHGEIVVLEKGSEIDHFPLFYSKKERILGRSRFLSRVLRLGVRAAEAIDKDTILLSVESVIYELSLKTKILSKGFSCGEGVRPLLFTTVKGIEGFADGVYFGGYVHNFEKEPVSIYHRKGCDEWEVVYTFPKGTINHVHSIITDPYRNCLWVLTGDFEESAAIWKAEDGFKTVERFVSGSQKWRGCVAFATQEGLLYATDAPFAQNNVYLLKDDKTVSSVCGLSGSCIYGCQWNDKYVFSTVVEPDGRNETLLRLLFGWKRGAGITDNYARIYAGSISGGFKEVYKEKKDLLPFIFQFGAFRFPSGINMTANLCFQPVATKENDMALTEISFSS